MEGQNLHAGDGAAPALNDTSDILNVLGIVGQVWNKNEPDPDLNASGGQPIAEGDRRSQSPARDLL